MENIEKYLKQVNSDFSNPVKIVCGSLTNLFKVVDGNHVLLVTTSGFVKRGMYERIKNVLSPKKISLWDGVVSNPDIYELDAAILKLKKLNPDVIIGLGGGSAIDSAKVLAAGLANSDSTGLIDLCQQDLVQKWVKRLPLVVIPTTSGTGSEVTPFATIWDRVGCKKYSLSGNFIYPDFALLDASLSLTLNELDTLFPALDALSHALESLWNKNRTPTSSMFSYSALNLMVKSLPEALKNPVNLTARTNLMVASTMSGLAISQTQTAVAHSISYPLTVHYAVPHGLACSFTLRHILESNINQLTESNPEQFDLLVSVLDLLDELSLADLIKKYIKIEDAKKYKLEMSSSLRARNYSGSKLGGIDNILEIGFKVR